MRKSFLPVSLLVLIICVAPICTLSASTLNLWDIFPQKQQGENGVNLFVYDTGSQNSRDLEYIEDYVFGTPGTMWNIPYIARGGEDNKYIITHPAGYEFGKQEQTILLVSFTQPVYISRIYGTITDAGDWGYVNFKIVASNMQGASKMLYSTDLVSGYIDYSVGPTSTAYQFIAFHVDPLGDSGNDTTYYSAIIEYSNTPVVPLPPTIILLGSALACFPILRRTRKF